jgi:hypothetical protein
MHTGLVYRPGYHVVQGGGGRRGGNSGVKGMGKYHFCCVQLCPSLFISSLDMSHLV